MSAQPRQTDGSNAELTDFAADDEDECECEDLPDGVPCFSCYLGGAEFDD